jgi:mRNA interferase HicA
MVKSSEFHKFIKKHGKKRGWYYTGESEGSHRIYKDSDGIRYPVPYHGSKEMGEGLRKKIIRDMELE